MYKIVSIVSIFLYCTVSNAQYGGFRDLPGDFCRIREGSTRCCDGRIDTCSVPISGTLCYCDQFCDRSRDPDCCPDYWEVCLGRPRPQELVARKTCPINGISLHHKQTTKINCNECECDDGTLTCENDRCLIDEAILDGLRDASEVGELAWTFSNHSFFWGKKLDEGMQRLTGTLTPGEKSLRMHPIKLHYDVKQIPNRFDARDKWRGLGEVRDQGYCGASWAFSTISVMEDRLAIGSDGVEIIELSPQSVLNCNRRGQQGCKGGHVERAWNFLRRRGVTTERCFPYVSDKTKTTDECKIHKDIKLLKDACPTMKLDKHGRELLYTTEPAYRISSKETDIMWEIMTTGPVQAIMKVFQDFFLYSGGIYSKSSVGEDSAFHIHSVKLLGWGEEKTRFGSHKYWLAQNSWGRTWGEDGLFRIRRGTNESDIEQFILAVRTHLAEEENNIFRRRRRN